MGPIDIKYHALSLAAVFLALGVGIIVGSSTNFFGISAILERQDQVIQKLETNYKEIRKEMSESKSQLEGARERIASLEGTMVPKLLEGRLEGLRVGVVTIGDISALAPEGDDSVAGPLKTADASVVFKLRLAPERLVELAGESPSDYTERLAKELLRGSAYGSKLTDAFLADGAVAAGGFSSGADAIVFALGKDLDPQLLRTVLIPLQQSAVENKGIVANVVFGESEPYQSVFKPTPYPYFQSAESINSQIDLIMSLREIQKQRQGKAGGF